MSTEERNIELERKGTRALIIGAGIAGLLAARVLSDYYEHVQIIEKDALSEEAITRSGTPQAFHLHNLALRGRKIVEQLFPDLIDDLLERGAFAAHAKTFILANPFGQCAMTNPDEGRVQCSRSMLEFALRQRVQAIPRIQLASELEVVGLQANADRTRITGVSVRPRGQMQNLSMLTADLIVDASGQFSKITQWLAELDYALPEPERVKVGIGYSTRLYRLSPQVNQETGLILIWGEPENQKRFAYGLQIENGLWDICLQGAKDLQPASDDRGFEQELRQIITPVLADTVENEGEPVSSARGYLVPECRLQHFEQMENWPAGLLVLGDALCNLDPMYGQGMSVAALEAEALNNALLEQQTNPQANFEIRTLQAFQEVIKPSWWLDAIADLRWPNTVYTGQEPPKAVALFHRYIDLYLQQAMQRMQEEIKSAEEPAAPPDLSSPEPSLLSYLLTIYDLYIPPQVVFNATTYRLLLEAEAAQSGPQRLHDLTNEYQLPLEEIMNEILPTFSSPLTSAPDKA
ncbi:hypothetical protein EPA93_05285 [Ktedonosporobacter rubrisoli]|uniref:FAD-dependent oxidoreductase n=1 Tax=Ktedonosporobacter rubrisoli TaxID=2509675 RepID=A0A4P6JJW7_KTERU|nr:hypothetical protein [Ktedonosporobacter rubrisoli]QBD75447.1 hypothetical protein EPA93_05285 [Ktedonosporobacter rubrisoli]